ncbi:MAG: VOC family protein [Bacilli bacterium]|nr:VOC family protein [Bacilli bacterium]
MKFNKLIPELSVSNINRSRDFYLQLGFEIKYERENNKFIFIELNGSQIMLQENNNNWNTGDLEFPYGRGVNFSIEVKDVSALYDYLMKRKYPLFSELMMNEYVVGGEKYIEKEFLIQDPDGYLLRFTQE